MLSVVVVDSVLFLEKSGKIKNCKKILIVTKFKHFLQNFVSECFALSVKILKI